MIPMELTRAIHVLTVMWLVGCILGRQMVRGRAEHATELRDVVALSEMATVFENMIRPASGVVLLLGLVTAWVRGWPILGFLQGGASNWVLASLLVYLSIIPVIALVFLPRGKTFRAALDGAVAEGRVTPALTAAMHDPVVRAAHAYEIVMIVVLTLLMTLKPF